MLICTAGEGWYQEDGMELRRTAGFHILLQRFRERIQVMNGVSL